MNLEGVRLRPGMYVGDTDDGTGLHLLLWEVVSNALSEHLAGHATSLRVVLEADGHVSVTDDGRGVSVDLTRGVPFLLLVATHLHAAHHGEPHRMHVGLLGIGLACVNAVSEEMLIEVRRDGSHYRLRSERGVVTGGLERLGSTNGHGTFVRFLPDAEIFCRTAFSFERVDERLQELARLAPRLHIELRDERLRERSYRAPNGLTDLLSNADGTLQVSGAAAGVQVAAALRWGTSSPPRLRGFVNLEPVKYGHHLAGLRQGIEAAVLRACDLRRRPVGFREAIGSGLEAVVHVLMPNPAFRGACRDELDSKEAERAVRGVLGAELAPLLLAHPKVRDELRRRLSQKRP